MLKYGTDGWYAVISDEFTMENAAKVARAAAVYLIHRDRQKLPLVVGFDARFLSDKFAQVVVKSMTDGGINCLLVERETPVPVIAWEVKDREAAGGLVVSGACRPAETNGIQLIAGGGRYLTPEEAREVDLYLSLEQSNLTANVPSQNLLTYQAGVSYLSGAPKGTETRFEPRERYLKYLQTQVDGALIKKAGLTIVVDPMHGSVRGYFDRFLQALGCRVEEINEHRDVLFGGRDPMPAKENMTALRARVTAAGAALGLAFCPSGERFGLVDQGGTCQAEATIMPKLVKYAEKGKGLKAADLRGNALLAGALLVEMVAAKIVL